MSTSDVAHQPLVPPLSQVQERLVLLAAAHFMADGEWPTLKALKRDCARRGEPLVVDLQADALPKDLGYVGLGAPHDLWLSIVGLERSGVARPFLEEYVRFVRFCWDRYLSEEETPSVSSAQLREELGFDDGTIARINDLRRSEPYGVGSGGGTSSTDWSFEIHDSIEHFASVSSVEELLEARARFFAPGTATDSPTATTPSSAAVPNHPLLDIDQLHPVIRNATSHLLMSGHHGDAVLPAAKAFAALLRASARLPDHPAGRPLDGSNLVEQAFTLIEVDHRGLRHQGIREVALGMMKSYRNQSAHDLKQLDDDEAIEAIATFSLLCRRIDEADFTGGAASP